MKKLSVLLILISISFNELKAQQYEFKVVTIIESIIPAGLGRSRIIDVQDATDYKYYTTSRSDGQTSNQDEVRRGDVKVGSFEETKLLNFYSLVGINFQNIASNDAVISSKINTLVSEGWELAFFNSAVESDAGKKDGRGIFITRMLFKRIKK